MSLEIVDLMELYAKALWRVGYLEAKLEQLEREVNDAKLYYEKNNRKNQ